MEGLIVLIVICVIGAIIGIAAQSKNKGKQQKCDDVINETYQIVFSRQGGSAPKQLEELLDYGTERLVEALGQYREEKQIHTTEDTCSNLGLCGVSDTHFYYGINFSTCKYETMNTLHDMFKEYALATEILSRNRYEDIDRWKKAFVRMDQISPLVMAAVKVFAEMKQNRCTVTADSISIDSIKYYKLEGAEHYISNVTGGGVNLQGAVAGAIIAGDAGAIIGSHLGTDTKTSIERKDNRKITLFYECNGVLETFVVETDDFDETLSAFRKLIPNKEESVVQMENQKNSTQSVAISSADELKKYKELLDSGVISQEEFDAKKKQLLGL